MRDKRERKQPGGSGRKLLYACAAAIVLAGTGTGWHSRLYALAADSSVIERLSVTFTTAYGDAEEIPEPKITVSGSGVSLGDVQYRTEYDNWKPGRKVRVEINIVADDGKYFPSSLGSSKCRVSGADYVSAKALDDNTLQVKADYTPVTVLGNTSEAGWSSTSSKKAVWKAVDYAPGYTLTLYGNDKVVKRMTVTDNSASLGEYMTDPDKIYYYEVKAVPVTAAQKKYLKEGEYVTSTEQELDEITEKHAASTDRTDTGGPGDSGSFKGDNYVSPDGSLAVNTWKKADGKWYYFGADGTRSRGWLNYGGRWYYMDGNGVMQTGWVDINNGSWFYLGPDGDMQTGWIQPVPGNWYYLNQYGYMERGWVLINGRWYYMDENGRMQTGWIQYKDNWYFLHSDGAMAQGTAIDGWQIGADGIARKE